MIKWCSQETQKNITSHTKSKRRTQTNDTYTLDRLTARHRLLKWANCLEHCSQKSHQNKTRLQNPLHWLQKIIKYIVVNMTTSFLEHEVLPQHRRFQFFFDFFKVRLKRNSLAKYGFEWFHDLMMMRCFTFIKSFKKHEITAFRMTNNVNELQRIHKDKIISNNGRTKHDERLSQKKSTLSRRDDERARKFIGLFLFLLLISLNPKLGCHDRWKVKLNLAPFNIWKFIKSCLQRFTYQYWIMPFSWWYSNL